MSTIILFLVSFILLLITLMGAVWVLLFMVQLCDEWFKTDFVERIGRRLRGEKKE